MIYSASALTNVRARVLGYATYTLAAAGTWNTAPSDVLLTRAGMMEVQAKELLYEKTLAAAGNFDTNEWWPSGTLPSGYDRLEFSCALRGADTGFRNVLCYLNGDSTATNYRSALHYAGSTHGSAVADTALIAECAGSDAVPSDTFTGLAIVCQYPASATNKELCGDYVRRDSAAAIAKNQVGLQWENTAAINRIQLLTNGASTNFVANSRVQIHGFKSVSILL